ncbi:Undecaprenyl-phosphate 4-deoxy-4-formamido-L-arabinose transferase [Sedimentisphaera cyanobacteriorum]|uniref:Undecaprenyl-phosphate 4-deoxy-4-formamido-L-arabinose transferase n=1 Tax=Sedimentisphaera cyanobacteriorum TaxID=1940790 RepID=A0A1Q2HRV1_9BACT|nr:glycosyltransferase family 2 protein [Sedimentisphaera cyanobacteriorum]AQQ09976.1 Undecaprenyl-phosphate 4-deoxy-4-formamido-L-arabinose transferase [Sedimentisphaera cyanobacteriorum]
MCGDYAVELSVISPMYNEEAVIGESVRGLAEAIEKLEASWELILVNDGSTDNTAAIIEKAAGEDERIRVVSYKRNRGRGYALRSGFNASRGKYVITTESDLTWGKDIIEKLYSELVRSEADVVIASPYTKGGRLENVPAKRAFLSRMGNEILKRTVPAPISMLSGMTRGYKGDIIRSLPLEQDRKEIHLEIVSKCVMLGLAFSEVPAVLKWQKPQTNAPKRKSKFKAGRLIKSHLLFSMFEAPVMLFGTLGFALLIIGAVFGFHLGIEYFIRGEVIGDRIIFILVTIFLLSSGFSMFLFCFFAYQIKTLQTELFKTQLLLHKKCGRENEGISN